MTNLTITATRGNGKRAQTVPILTADLPIVTVDGPNDEAVSTLAFGTSEAETFDERSGASLGTVTVADQRRTMPLDGAAALLAEPFALSAVLANGDERRTVALPIKFARRNGKPRAEGTATIEAGGRTWNVTVSVRVASKRTGDEVAVNVRARETTVKADALPSASLASLFGDE